MQAFGWAVVAFVVAVLVTMMVEGWQTEQGFDEGRAPQRVEVIAC